MKKIHHSTSAVTSAIAVTILLIGGWVFILTGMKAYGQEEEQPQQQPTSLFSPRLDRTPRLASFIILVVESPAVCLHQYKKLLL